MPYPSVTKCFLDAVDRYACPRAQIVEDECGLAESITAGEMLRRVAGLAKALQVLGVKPGDRVALLAPNCPEWHVVDFAIQGIGAVHVPLYFNESPDRMMYILNDSGAKIAIAAGEKQARTVGVVPRPVAGARASDCGLAAFGARRGNFELRYVDRDRRRDRYRRVSPLRRGCDFGSACVDHLHIGNDGRAEGRDAVACESDFECAGWSGCDGGLPSDVGFRFAALARLRADHRLRLFFHGVAVAYVEQIEDVVQALVEVHPTIVAAVPRFFEKIYGSIFEKARRETTARRKIFDWALGVATRASPWRAYGRRVFPAGRDCNGK